MTCASTTSDPERSRPGSIVAVAEGRSRFVAAALLAAPALVFLFGPVALQLAAVVMLAAVLVAVRDVVDWVRLALAARRMRRGLPPRRVGVDFGVGEDCWTRVVPAAAPYRGAPSQELLARGSPVAARRVVGGYLVRSAVLIVLPALYAASWYASRATVTHGLGRPGAREVARTQLMTLRSAAIVRTAAKPDVCPTVDELRAGGDLDRSFPLRDPWGSAWRLMCEDDEVTATSCGPDRKAGTADDVVVPQP